MKYFTKYIIGFVYTAFLILVPQQIKASVNIDSTQTTISRCPNNGSITIFASTNQTSLLYSITDGPELRPYQVNALFQGLKPGIYLITVSNILSETDTQTVVVKGSNYIEPDFSPISKEPTCFGGSDGQIIGRPILANSRKPFTWVLTNTQTNVTTTQSSDTFNNLKASTYTLRMYDSCQNFVTRTIFINNDDTIFKEIYIAPNFKMLKIGCDTMLLRFYFYTSKQNYTGTYKLTMYSQNDTIIKFIKPRLYSQNYPFFGVNTYEIKDTFPNINYGADFHFILEDNCGKKIISPQNKIPVFRFITYPYYIDNVGCTGNLGAFLQIFHNLYTDPPSIFFTPFMPKYPLTMVVKDISANTVVQTSTINSGLLNITPKIAGRNYLITITDVCGDFYAFDTIWPIAGKPSVGVYKNGGCIDSTASVQIECIGFGPGLKVEMLSGPKYLRSSKIKYNYLDSIIYPKTYTVFISNVLQNNNINIELSKTLKLKNLPEGVYKYKVTDSCLNEIVDSFIIREYDVANLNHSTSFKKGCLGQNILYYRSNPIKPYQQPYINIRNLTNGGLLFSGFVSTTSFDSITSISSGKYEVSIANFGVENPINENIQNCWTVYDTVEIPLYERPKINSFSTIYCNGNRYAELLPDSSKGIAPYQYEIIAGPRLYPLQTSNVFNFIPIGNYTCRIVDACGNSNVIDFGVDTLIFPSITKIGSSCLNGNFSLFFNTSKFFTYHWIKPNGTVYIGDTLNVYNTTNADTGIYYITKYVNINNCKDSFTTSYRLTSTTSYTRNISICDGESVMLGTHVYTETGNYIDTILSQNCDTLYNLNLTVNEKFIKTINAEICVGQRYFFANNYYTDSGTYTHTFTSSTGCDSIVILKLNVLQNITLQIIASKLLVLPGDTVQLNAISNVALPDFVYLFNWVSIATLNDTTIKNPIATINQASWIYINVKTEESCINNDSIFIDIINDCKAENVFIPNSFSPNKDGINDEFRVRSNILLSGKLEVYNRWGNKVFESDNLLKGWDGTYKGKIEQEEAYGYIFEGKCLNGESIIRKGNVTLIK